MPRLVRELDNLVFDRGAVTRTNSFYLTTIQRRSRYALLKNPVGLRGSVGNVAGDLRSIDSRRHERKRCRLGVAMLWFESRPIDGSPIQPRRRPGFHPSPLKIQSSKLVAQ